MTFEVENDHDDDFFVDDDAKCPIDLFKKFDSNNEAYYIGKLQANFRMDLDAGQSFMIFLSDENAEQIQIGPLNPERRKFARQQFVSGSDRITVPLKKLFDAHGAPFYVGELVQMNTLINLSKGLFFAVFVSREGYEQIQITPLKAKRKYRDNSEY